MALLVACWLGVITTAHSTPPVQDSPPFGNTATHLAEAWQRSCTHWATTKFRKAPTTLMHQRQPQFGTVGTWQTACQKSANLPAEALLDFFNTHFTRVAMDPTKYGGNTKFTGYYKPLLQGSLTRTKAFNTPLVAMPKPLPSPAPTRAQIDAALQAKNPLYKPLVWLDAVDAYFLHIQGGGTIVLPSGQALHVGFAGKNGHKYTAIGKYMKQQGYLSGTISAERIKSWLRKNPDKLAEVMHSNASYIFFRIMKSESPGALGVPLVAGRSLAVDPDYFPLGVPVFVRTVSTHNGQPWRRLMFAQDIGSAIQGTVRGDIYFGHGPQAGEYASDQNSPGQLFALIPKP
jgi:membrane-bound lytic murein transglycosylase A